MTFQDGQTVSYIGPATPLGLQPGDQGMVLSDAGSGAHVMWSTGSVRGKVTLTDDYDLSAVGLPITASYDDGLDDSLDVGTLTMTGVLATYDEEGPAGVLAAMASAGRLDGFTGIAHEALGLIQTRLRHDPAIAVVIAQLGEQEGEALVSLAATVLLRDAFGVEAQD